MSNPYSAPVMGGGPMAGGGGGGAANGAHQHRTAYHKLINSEVGFVSLPQPLVLPDDPKLAVAIPDIDFRLEDSVLQQIEILRAVNRQRDEELSRKQRERNERRAREWKEEASAKQRQQKEAKDAEEALKAELERQRAASAAAAAKAALDGPPPAYGSGISVAGGPPIPSPGEEGSQPGGGDAMSDPTPTPPGAGGAAAAAAAAAAVAKPYVVRVASQPSKTAEQLMVDALTELQRDTLVSFKGVTSAANDVSCIRLLTAMNWNLNRAIESYFQYNENIDLAISKAPKPSSSIAAAVQPSGAIAVALPVSAAAAANPYVSPFQPNNNRPIAGAASAAATPYAIPVVGGASGAYAYPAIAKPVAAVAAGGGGSGRTTLTITLPDNTLLTQHFNAEDTLWIVYEFTAQNAQKWGSQNWTLQATHPITKYFPDDQLNQTLRQAGLVPSANMKMCLGTFR